MSKILGSGRYRWDDYMSIRCKREDKVKLKKVHKLWQSRYNVKMTFTAWLNAVIFPTFMRKFLTEERKKRKAEEEKVKNEMEKRI